VGVLIFSVLAGFFAVFLVVHIFFKGVPVALLPTFLFYIIILAQGSRHRLIPPPVYLGLNTIANFAIAVSLSFSSSYNALIPVPQYPNLLVISHLTFCL
jgi:hypothetical protein